MLLSDFQFELPQELIAQQPLPQRDASRMLILDRAKASLGGFGVSPPCRILLRGDELIVVNNARVIPARLFGRREGVTLGKAGQQSPHHARIFVLCNRSPADPAGRT